MMIAKELYSVKMPATNSIYLSTACMVRQMWEWCTSLPMQAVYFN